MSNDTPLEGYLLTLLPSDEKSQVSNVTSNGASKTRKKNSSNIAKEIVPIEDRSYSGRQLMKRLRCGDRLLKIKREQPDFRQWSKERDPEDISWQYSQGKFIPVKDSHVSDLITPVEERPYSNRQLMKRFRCGDRLLKIKRQSPGFTEWSQQRDPEGIAWHYQNGKFIPHSNSPVQTDGWHAIALGAN